MWMWFVINDTYYWDERMKYGTDRGMMKKKMMTDTDEIIKCWLALTGSFKKDAPMPHISIANLYKCLQFK